MGFSSELKVARLAVQRASRLAKMVSEAGFQSITKSDDSPVTVADFGAQAIIISAIKNSFPNDQIVGEEDAGALRENDSLASKVYGFVEKAIAQSSEAEKEVLGDIKTQADMLNAIDLGNYQGGKGSRFWALDPIDGTKGFVRQEQYAVCLALLDESAKVQVAVIGCPNLKTDYKDHSPDAALGALFSAVRGDGAFVEPLFKDDVKSKIAISFNQHVATSDASFCESAETGHSNRPQQEAIAKELGIVKPPVRMDSQAKYCSAARGDGDIYLRLPVSLKYEEKIWDHAAGSLLVEESGGVVSDCRGSSLDFSQGRTLKANKGVVVASKQLYPDVIQVIAELQERQDVSDSAGVV